MILFNPYIQCILQIFTIVPYAPPKPSWIITQWLYIKMSLSQGNEILSPSSYFLFKGSFISTLPLTYWYEHPVGPVCLLLGTDIVPPCSWHQLKWAQLILPFLQRRVEIKRTRWMECFIKSPAPTSLTEKIGIGK